MEKTQESTANKWQLSHNVTESDIGYEKVLRDDSSCSKECLERKKRFVSDKLQEIRDLAADDVEAIIYFLAKRNIEVYNAYLNIESQSYFEIRFIVSEDRWRADGTHNESFYDVYTFFEERLDFNLRPRRSVRISFDTDRESSRESIKMRGYVESYSPLQKFDTHAW